MQAKKETVLKLGESIPRLQRQLKVAKGQVTDLEERIGTLQAELSEILEAQKSLAELKPNYQAYIAKKKQLSKLGKTVNRYASLDKEKGKLEAEIAREEKNLVERADELEQEIRRAKRSLEERAEKLKEVSGLQKRQQELEEAVKPSEDIEKQIAALKDKISENRGLIKTKEEELRKSKLEWTNIQKIGMGAPCPRCKQKLSKEHLETVRLEFEKEFKDIQSVITQASEDIAKDESEKQQLDSKSKLLVDKKNELQNLLKRLARFEGELTSLERDNKSLADNQTKLRGLKSQLKQGRFAVLEKRRLKQVSTNLVRLAPFQKQFETLKQEIDALEKTKIERRYAEILEKISRKTKLQREIRSAKSGLKQAQMVIVSQTKELKLKESQFKRLEGVVPELQKWEEKKEELDQQLVEARNMETTISEHLKVSKEKIDHYKADIEEKEAQLGHKEVYEQVKIWLTEYLTPSLADIEVHVLTSIREEFDQMFQRWFGSLIEAGDITVRIDEGFTPIVEQSGYELEVASLSGGERTTLALAYRLALNIMVKRVCQAMHSNLLILDEPTDGFSKEQLFKLRDVLKELGCEQVIMVSHERELEGFVDKVYRVRKEAGVSTVVAVP